MVFNLFGKRDKQDPQPDPQAASSTALEPAQPAPPQEKRGFFDPMNQAGPPTRESLSESISSVIALTREVDESTLIDLEPILLSADLGAPTTALVLENLRQ